jgi:hypothetical protein
MLFETAIGNRLSHIKISLILLLRPFLIVNGKEVSYDWTRLNHKRDGDAAGTILKWLRPENQASFKYQKPISK